MKNPLNKRWLRDLKSDIGKYLVIFILLVLTIGFVSGFLVADNSMIIAYNDSFAKYNIEDGNFTLSKKANAATKKEIEELGIHIYENFYSDLSVSNDTTMRIYKNRKDVDLVCLMKGTFPQAEDEIAIDRMYADNNNLSVGNTFSIENNELKVVGLVSLSDYSALFSDNDDMMFDSVKFGVGIVTDNCFESLTKTKLIDNYAYKLDNKPSSDTELNEVTEELMKKVSHITSVESFVPEYSNQAIHFTGDDMGSDKAMMIVLLYIVIVIMAFVFSITTKNTIHKEANVIGTLRASGYTKKELIHHYMVVPVEVTIVGAIIGNILGYTCIKDVCAGMYYGSYSLPTYTTIWNSEAFILTTIIPVLIMVVVNYVLLKNSLSLSPLKFIRRDLSKTKNRKAIHLSKHIPFFDRFRTRVILQNISNYITLFIGILFANLLLLFGLILPSILKDYQASIENNLFSQYQTILKMPYSALDEDKPLESLVNLALYYNRVETDTSDAEKFSAYTLETINENYKKESVQLYGIINGSKYIDIDFEKTPVVISHAYAEKYHLKIGDSITLHKPYSDDNYSFTIDGIYPYDGAICLFMAKDNLNEMFDLGDSFFCGYFSNEPITDIDEKNIANVVDVTSLTKVSRQLDVSMGSMMYLVDGFAILIFVILIYLLSKIIIEKNAQSISMVKILGYTNLEISKLYIIATSIMVILFILISFPIEEVLMTKIYQEMLLMELSGYLPITFSKIIYIKMFLLGVGTYAIVAIFEYKKIERITLVEALKNVE